MRASAWIPVLVAALTLTGCGDEEEAPASAQAIEGLAVERIDEDSVRITWSDAAGEVQVRQADVAADAPSADVVAKVDGAREVVIDGLDPTQRWYFAVGQEGGPVRVVAERLVPLAGAANFRDVGGYATADGERVRWGLAFRADALSDLTPEDQALGANMGVTTIVDLRTAAEVQQAPDKPIDGATQVQSEIVLDIDPVTVCTSEEPTDVILDTAYRQILDDNATLFADLIARHADAAELPLVTHCSGGKDRTGIATALLLSLLGVPDEQIVEDYTLSALYLAELVEQRRPLLKALGCTDERIDTLLSAKAEQIETTLSYVRTEHGSVEAYLKSGGLDDAGIAGLKSTLLE